jgi:hypothetical protein
VELHEDGPRAVMCILWYIYDMPYQFDGTVSWPLTLAAYASLYVTADKYLAKGLQRVICNSMETRMEGFFKINREIVDFVGAIRTIFSFNLSEELTRSLMVKACIMNLRALQGEETFLSLP